MSKRRIYIAGPMKGYKDHNYENFERISLMFFEDPVLFDRWETVNPVEIGESFGTVVDLDGNPELLKRLMEFELAAVKSCDAIFLLHGWEKSQGARAELRVALENDSEVITEDDADFYHHLRQTDPERP